MYRFLFRHFAICSYWSQWLFIISNLIWNWIEYMTWRTACWIVKWIFFSIARESVSLYAWENDQSVDLRFVLRSTVCNYISTGKVLYSNKSNSSVLALFCLAWIHFQWVSLGSIKSITPEIDCVSRVVLEKRQYICCYIYRIEMFNTSVLLASLTYFFTYICKQCVFFFIRLIHVHHTHPQYCNCLIINLLI